MPNLPQSQDYKNWLSALKATIKSTQIKAALAVNSSLIQLYWELGEQIVEKQEHAKWGSGFIKQLSKDLKEEFPDISWFSKRNLAQIRQWFLFYRDDVPIVKQLVSQLQNTENQLITKYEQVVGQLPTVLFQIPWGHHIKIL